ncbi:MAG: hypothetical protein NTW03_03530 [Verrucomicrobia bacterium]|nr:hypothetical protein [Verrucomicrobiota bacterium]
MKQLGFAAIVVLSLAACSPQEDAQAKKPVTLDKAEIDVAEMSKFIKDRPVTNWWCLLAKPKAEDEDKSWKRVQALTHRTVCITDGPEVLATGQIAGIITTQGKFTGLDITFQTPKILDDLENRLGIHRTELPPSLRDSFRDRSKRSSSTNSPASSR